MRAQIMRIALAAAVTFSVNSAYGAESWQVQLPGGAGGGAYGALPPSGGYFIDLNAYGPWLPFYNNSGHSDQRVTSWVNAPTFLWSTPYQVLGAQYAVGITEAFDGVFEYDQRTGTTVGGGGTFGTIVTPLALSWTLPDNLHLSVTESVTLPTGAYRSPFSGNPYNLLAIDYYAFDTQLGLSYLTKDWNISGLLYYLANTNNDSIDYHTGNLLGSEWTVIRNIDKWQVGWVGYVMYQVQDDSGRAYQELGYTGGHRVKTVGTGGVVGYDFGPFTMQLWAETAIRTYNYPGETFIYTRLVAPLWVDKQPLPVSAKD